MLARHFVGYLLGRAVLVKDGHRQQTHSVSHHETLSGTKGLKHTIIISAIAQILWVSRTNSKSSSLATNTAPVLVSSLESRVSNSAGGDEEQYQDANFYARHTSLHYFPCPLTSHFSKLCINTTCSDGAGGPRPLSKVPESSPVFGARHSTHSVVEVLLCPCNPKEPSLSNSSALCSSNPGPTHPGFAERLAVARTIGFRGFHSHSWNSSHIPCQMCCDFRAHPHDSL